MPGVFPDYPAPVVRNAGTERETAPNAVVAPIHPKAMPVILTTVEECDV